MTDRAAVSDGVVDALRRTSDDNRNRLLARMAGSIAAGFTSIPHGIKSEIEQQQIAIASVMIARFILVELKL